jgi:hypothetical protein
VPHGARALKKRGWVGAGLEELLSHSFQAGLTRDGGDGGYLQLAVADGAADRVRDRSVRLEAENRTHNIAVGASRSQLGGDHREVWRSAGLAYGRPA